ncbi:Hypp7978 [Branchiostoma lanceolatum]|uniref:Hypp7978 protein n=1 Tax=Branchiostoma lanceolatum TaxID=7740 RepID=A0A8K0EGJ4_BRALA|nr:Hypp7978 [Branchiostoma lanceolatum]
MASELNCVLSWTAVPYLVAIFLLKTSKLYWTLATGSGSDAAHKIHGRTLKMATRNETRLETLKRNLYDIVDTTAEEPYYLARGVISFGKPSGGGGGGGGLAPLGWGGDWTIMLYIGIGLISTITALAFIVCCLLYRRKKLLKKWNKAQTDADSAAVMANISNSERNAQPKESP